MFYIVYRYKNKNSTTLLNLKTEKGVNNFNKGRDDLIFSKKMNTLSVIELIKINFILMWNSV